MIRLLHGANEFAITEELTALKNEVEQADVTEADGTKVAPAELLDWCFAIPFMSSKRIVVVRKLFEHLEQIRFSAPSKETREFKKKFTDWQKNEKRMELVPPTTELLFAEQTKIKDNHPLKRLFGNVLEVELYDVPRSQKLVEWVAARFHHHGAKADRAVAQRLAELIGGKIRLLDSEIAKLATHADDRQVTVDDVDMLVSSARDANIFQVVDAVIEGRVGQAMTGFQKMLEEGETFAGLLARLTAQLRRIALTSEMLRNREPQTAIAEKLNIKYDFILRRTLTQARKTGSKVLGGFEKLHEIDLAVKTGTLDEVGAVQRMVMLFG